jgi:3-polyprenyl-4-hydroxybenzoate decarboxylase
MAQGSASFEESLEETAVTGDASSGTRQTTPWLIAPVSQRLVAGLVDATVLALVGLAASGILRRNRSVERRRALSVVLVALDAAYRIGSRH